MGRIKDYITNQNSWNLTTNINKNVWNLAANIDDWVEETIKQMYADGLIRGASESEPGLYVFPLYIRNKQTKLVYKLLTSYEDNPGGLYTRQDDFDARVLLKRWELLADWEIV